MTNQIIRHLHSKSDFNLIHKSQGGITKPNNLKLLKKKMIQDKSPPNSKVIDSLLTLKIFNT